MKKLSLIFVFVVALLFIVNIDTSATGLNEEFVHYKISRIENFDASGNIEKAWALEYRPGAGPVIIVKRRAKSATYYVVKSEFFEVCYAAGHKGFGVAIMRNNWRDVPEELSNAVINAEAMKGQGILTPNKIGDEKALALIACYLPRLLNDSYKHLLN